MSKNREGLHKDDGKIPLQLLSPIALNKIAEVMGHTTFKIGKYPPNNWREGISWNRILGSLLRHVNAYLGGEDIDPETGLSHMAHAGCDVMFLLEYEETHRNLDDRYKVLPLETSDEPQ